MTEFDLIKSNLETLSTVVDSVEVHASTDKTRTVLTAIAVTAKGEWVATNGHTLALVTVDPGRGWEPWTSEEDQTVLLPAKTLRQALAAARKVVPKRAQAATPAVITVGQGRWTLTVGGNVTAGELVPGPFPNWRAVWPADPDTPPVYKETGWASNVLAQVAESGHRLGDNLIFSWRWHGVLQPSVAKTHTWLGDSRATLTVLAMPARI